MFVGENFHRDSDTLCVCRKCLMAIESHEGRQITEYLDDDECGNICDWCEEESDGLYIILGKE